MTDKVIEVEVVYALPQEQYRVHLQVPVESKVEAVIHQSGILYRFPEIDLSHHQVGIFSRLVKLDAQVVAHDRIEIYRPLLADPKEIRRRRAEQAKLAKQTKAKQSTAD